MPHVRPTASPRLLAVLLAVLVLALTPASPARAGQQALFDKALEGFSFVQAKESRSGRRDLWLQVHDRFEAVLKAGPDTGYAPKALYYMGRCYEELAERSYLRSDAHRAADYFQRAVARFAPGHSWIDDCLYRKAEITLTRLNDAGSAAADLRTIRSLYSRGDQAAKAAKLLARIEGRRDEAAAPAPKASRAPAAKAAAPERSADPGYGATVRAFKALRADSGATREQFQRIARRFEDLSKTTSDGTYAARAAYFAGFAWDELGRRSGREEDFRAAAGQYERAVEMFKDSDSWRDDALFRKGYVEYKYLEDEDQAYADLLLVVRDYAGGDQAVEAKALLRAMDEARAGQMPDTAGPADAPAPIAPEVRPASAGSAASASFGGGTGSATLSDIRHFTGDDFTRVVLDLDNAVKFKERSLPAAPGQGKPPRMFVDLEKTRIGPQVRGSTDVGGGFLRCVRAAQNTPDTVRVVLDFKDEQEYHILTLENPYRIVIDVFAQDTVEAKAPVAAAPLSAPAAPRKPGKAQRDTAKDVLAQLGMTIGTVMIDAGHGGRDPGALEYVRDKKGRRKIRTKEKDVTLRLSRILGDQLEAKGYRVLYSRPEDKKVALEDRVLKANMQKADLFISLHCNANRSGKVRGFETYFLGKAKNNIVLRLAAKENDVDPVKISDTQKIVLDLVHSFKIEESKVLARHVQDNCVGALRGKFKGIKDHGARSAPFFVLIGAKMPAVLVEAGYLSNSTEAKLLRNDVYLESVARGIVAGIEAYKKELRTAAL
ncbi:N-acetylmuramoyl-L-alanine amidase [Desulfocurvus sp. DL9XJH121]